MNANEVFIRFLYGATLTFLALSTSSGQKKNHLEDFHGKIHTSQINVIAFRCTENNIWKWFQTLFLLPRQQGLTFKSYNNMYMCKSNNYVNVSCWQMFFFRWWETHWGRTGIWKWCLESLHEAVNLVKKIIPETYFSSFTLAKCSNIVPHGLLMLANDVSWKFYGIF